MTISQWHKGKPTLLHLGPKRQIFLSFWVGKKKTPLHRVVKDQAPDPATQWRE